MLYPINLNLTGRRVVLVGGGKVALRRVETLLKTGAAIVVVAPDVEPKLAALAADGRITLRQRPYEPADVAGALLVMTATPDPAVNERAARDAKAAGILVNMCAAPKEYSDFFVPAHVEREDLLVTVATSGRSPALSRVLRMLVESEVVDPFSEFMNRLTPLRDEAQAVIPPEQRADFWRDVMNDEFVMLVQEGELDAAEAMIKNALGRFRA